jgi:DNA-binding NarL/FixJ family response regulator
MKAKLLIVDDFPLMLAALRQAFESQVHLPIVGEASTGETAVKLALELKPNLVLMDIHKLC